MKTLSFLAESMKHLFMGLTFTIWWEWCKNIDKAKFQILSLNIRLSLLATFVNPYLSVARSSNLTKHLVHKFSSSLMSTIMRLLLMLCNFVLQFKIVALYEDAFLPVWINRNIFFGRRTFTICWERCKNIDRAKFQICHPISDWCRYWPYCESLSLARSSTWQKHLVHKFSDVVSNAFIVNVV